MLPMDGEPGKVMSSSIRIHTAWRGAGPAVGARVADTALAPGASIGRECSLLSCLEAHTLRGQSICRELSLIHLESLT
jgi:hypothetical protein